LALLGANSTDILQLLLEVADAARNLSAVGFQLSFTGAAGTDAASKLRHFYAVPC
jgi:hypothetical protein